MARLDDLTILLTMVDKTGKAFKSVDKKLSRMQKLTKAVTVGAKLMGGALVGAFVAAARNGGLITDQLSAMSRQLNLTLQESQALFNAVRTADPSTQVDRLNEALLTMKERFSDARDSGGGPLFGLIEKFDGFELDLGVDNARLQLADFLEQVSELDDANAKIFALKDILGDEDSRPFLNTINNTEKLNKLLVDLRTNVNELPEVMSAGDVENITQAKDAAFQLNKAWDDFSVTVSTLVAPAIAGVNRMLTRLIKAGSKAAKLLKKLFNTGGDETSNLIGLIDPSTEAERENQLRLIDERIGKVKEQVSLEKEVSETAKNSFFGGRRYLASQELVSKGLREINTLMERRLELEGLAINSEKVAPVGPRIKPKKEKKEKFQRAPFGPEDQDEADFINSLGTDSFAGRFNIQQADFDSFEELMKKMQETATERARNTREALLSVGNAFGQMAELAANRSEKSFKVFKRIQIALSTVAAYSAAVQSLQEAKGDPLLRIAAYAQILSVGLGAIAQMRSVNVGGGGGSAGASASAGATSPQSTARGGTAPTETRSAGRTIIQLEGRDRTYDQTDIENLVDAFKQSGADIEVLYN